VITHPAQDLYGRDNWWPPELLDSAQIYWPKSLQHRFMASRPIVSAQPAVRDGDLTGAPCAGGDAARPSADRADPAGGDRRGASPAGADRRGADPAGADAGLRAKEAAENFPVAMRLLPRRHRTHLRAIYDVVRTIDDLGDEAAGDRVALLDEFAADLERVWLGDEPRAGVLRRLVPTARARALDPEPFRHLIEANRQDQRVTGYQSYPDLIGYCRLSARPVGRLVLCVFDASTPRTRRLSDRICDALQLVEHWQDIAEDRRAGRIYLPREDLDRFCVAPADLDAPVAGAPLRRLVAFETGRARALLDAGEPLVGLLHGWARVAVAGYLAGGRAAIDGLRRRGYDVLAGSPPGRRRDVARHALGALARGRSRP
jgi:squalene synthase HpnC